jgi:hypothetical protein
MVEAVDENDLFTEISTQDRQVTVGELNRQVRDFFNKSKASVEELETHVTTELQEIVTQLTDQKAILRQFAQQEKHLTESTIV